MTNQIRSVRAVHLDAKNDVIHLGPSLAQDLEVVTRDENQVESRHDDESMTMTTVIILMNSELYMSTLCLGGRR